MAVKITVKSLKILKLFKSEQLLRDISIKYDPFTLLNKYKEDLKNLEIVKMKDIQEYVYFAPATFKIYPASVVKGFISNSFDIFKNRDLIKNVEGYNSILQSYIVNSIDFDVDIFLQEMSNNNIKYDKNTYKYLIKYYCDFGKMDCVERLVEKMTLMNEIVIPNNKMDIMRGYIITRQPEKAMQYMLENNLDNNDPKICIRQAFGYATIGDINTVMKIINKINSSSDNTISSDNYFRIYRNLIKANTPEKDLEKILSLIKTFQADDIHRAILSLNRAGLFEYSLKLLKKHQDILLCQSISSDLIISFNSNECPTNTYKDALKILLLNNYQKVMKNLFYTMKYDDAIIFANDVINALNEKHIISSLINNAININKSISTIEKSLTFAMDKLDMRDFNTMLYFDLIPSMLSTGISLNCQEILDTLPTFKEQILPLSLLYCLINDLTEFHTLKDSTFSRDVHFVIRIIPLTYFISEHKKSVESIDKLMEQAYMIFDRNLVNDILSELITKKIISSSTCYDLVTMQKLTKLAEKYHVKFNNDQYDNLMKKSFHHRTIFGSIFHTDKSTNEIKRNYRNIR